MANAAEIDARSLHVPYTHIILSPTDACDACVTIQQYTESGVVWNDQTVEGMYRSAVGLDLFEKAIISANSPLFDFPTLVHAQAIYRRPGSL